MTILNSLNKYKLLLVILLVASVLRLWNLQSMPPHLRNDEAALGYNAYSILNTGRDEHGEFLPIIFQSFGDWKPGLYIYLTIPFIASLGLNELAVRLPSALAGAVAVLFMYGVSLELLKKRKIAIISSVLLSVSPIFVPFSRGAWEVNVSFTLTLAGIYFFLKSFKKEHKFLLLSVTFFGLALLCSHGAKFSTPVIMTILILIFFRKFKTIPPIYILSSLIIIFLFAIPVIFSFSQGKITRLTTLSIFSYPRDSEYVRMTLNQGGETKNSPSYYLFHSETFSFIKSILYRALSIYSFNALFIKGDYNPQHGAPNTGPFLLFDSLFLLFGLIKLSKQGFNSAGLFIWFSLFLLSLPSALTIEKLNFERILTFFIPLIIIISIGIDYFWEVIKNNLHEHRFSILFFIVFFYIVNYSYFLDQYFIHGAKKNDAWQYGYKQMVRKITPIESKYQELIIQQSLEQPYIFFLFYQKYDPTQYQKIVNKVFIPNKEGKDMGLVTQIRNLKFEDINWKVKKPNKGTLYAIPEYKLKQQAEFDSLYKVVDEIKDLNGFPLFKIIETI